MAVQGAEVVFGDLDDIESLKRGFKGAYGVYGITDCRCLVSQLGSFSLPALRANGLTNVNNNLVFSCTSPEQEVQQGMNIVDAAKECAIQHMVWSTLERSKYEIIHFETKYLRPPPLVLLPGADYATGRKWTNT